MSQFIAKIFLSALIIACVSELAKRNSFIAALIAALPLTSLLAIVWLYLETKDLARIASLSKNIFWAVLPSLVFFIVLPLCLRKGLDFWISLGVSATSTLLLYLLYYRVLRVIGI